VKRLLDEGGSVFERDLLGALREERPSPELLARMQHGLGIASGAAAAGAGATAATFAWAKLALAGLAAVGLAVGASVALRQQAPPDALAVAPTLKPVPVRVEASKAVPGPVPVAVSDLAVADEESAEKEVAAPVRARPAASVTVDLRDEIRLLDQARAAVRAGNGSEALALLGKYNRRYPRGQFRQEAQVLRVEALEQSGQKEAAAELGKQFVAAHPESPHVERVERVTGQ